MLCPARDPLWRIVYVLVYTADLDGNGEGAGYICAMVCYTRTGEARSGPMGGAREVVCLMEFL